MSELAFTGERFIPGTRGEIWIEHWHRYHFASRWAAGQRVLDVACGEGYGAAYLARAAREVTGVDVAPAAIAHARQAYEGTANLHFLQGDCAALPLADASVDVVTSFETLEHIEPQARFMEEIARVLAPEGVLVLSCPNKLEYTDRRGYANEFHVKELYREELAKLVAARFPHAAWYGQKPTFYSVIAPEGRAAAGALVEVEEARPAEALERLTDPLYFIVVASRSRAALDAVAAPVHVLADRGEWVRRDYEKVMKWMQDAVAQRDALQAKLDQREREPTATAGWRERVLKALGLVR